MCSTHFGMPASLASSAKIIVAPGSFSLGLSTIVLPEVVAIGIIQRGTIAGKLNGHIPATTYSIKNINILWFYEHMILDTLNCLAHINYTSAH